MLLLLHNTTVFYTLASSNIATGKPAVRPPEHWLQVSAAHAAQWNVFRDCLVWQVHLQLVGFTISSCVVQALLLLAANMCWCLE
jgi:hypothetical protein